MDMMGESAAPVGPGERIDTLDVLRGVAICGILLMNIPMMGGIPALGGPALPARWDADWITYGVIDLLFEGTMRGLFTFLFGAGMLLMLRRAEGPDATPAPIDVWTRRCLLLMALGIVQFAVFFWPGEILWCYGMVGLALLAFRTAKVRTLLIAAGILLVGLTGWTLVETKQTIATLRASGPAATVKASGRPLNEDQRRALRAADAIRKVRHPTPAETDKERQERTHLGSLFAWSQGFWTDWNLGTDQWAWLAETLAFMLVGMALYRSAILTGGAQRATYARMIVIGYTVGVSLRAVELVLRAQGGFDGPISAPNGVEMFYSDAIGQIARLAITCGHVGLIVSLFRSGRLGRAWPLRALGRMALTVYSLQSVLTSLIFYGFGLVGQFGLATLEVIAVAIWLATGLFACAWLRHHEMGPAEWLLRAGAYGHIRRPLRRRIPVPAL